MKLAIAHANHTYLGANIPGHDHVTATITCHDLPQNRSPPPVLVFGPGGAYISELDQNIWTPLKSLVSLRSLALYFKYLDPKTTIATLLNSMDLP